METSSPTTAIIFFAFSASRETSRKKLMNESKANTALLEALRAQSLQKAMATQFPVFEFNEHNQRGANFGERLQSAFDSVFSQNFERVICIGADCPELTSEDLTTAANALSKTDIVIGPDLRKGMFLLAMNRYGYEQLSFEALAWQSPQLIESLHTHCQQLSIFFLNPKFDLNKAFDLCAQSNSTVLKKLLKVIRSTLNTATYHFNFLCSILINSQLPQRAPPMQ
ncbi:DUF2064 domain-containing protein [Roseivirga thermotolerans]|nr:DUF2064 domain-containing protein [Roseivirga thermotolerans]